MLITSVVVAVLLALLAVALRRRASRHPPLPPGPPGYPLVGNAFGNIHLAKPMANSIDLTSN